MGIKISLNGLGRDAVYDTMFPAFRYPHGRNSPVKRLCHLQVSYFTLHLVNYSDTLFLMKRFYLLFLAFLPFSGFSQNTSKNTYIDAIKLAQLYEAVKERPADDNSTLVAEFQNILSKYSYGPVRTILPQDLILNFVNKTGTGPVRAPAGIGSIPYDEKDLMPAAAGSMGWQAAAVNGLADFMAGRFRQEVLHYGLTNVFKRISKEDSVVFSALFPATLREVERLQKESGFYSADVVFLRQVIQTDLDQLSDRLVEEMDVVFPKLSKNPMMKDFFQLGYYIHRSARHGKNVPEIIQALSEKGFSTREQKVVSKLTSLLSTALRDTGTVRLWVDPSRLNGTLGEKNLVPTYFFALLYEQLEEDQILREEVLFRLGPGDAMYAEKLRPMLAYFNDFNEAQQYLKQNQYILEAGEKDEFLRLVLRGVRTFIASPAVREHLFDVPEEARNKIQSYVRISQPLMEKDYKKAIPVLINEMSQYLPGDAGKYRRSVVFVSQLASVSKAEDMEELLLAYSLPVGGSSIKRSSKWNISVNGYVGGTGGWETAYGSAARQTKGNIGLSAPIGVSVTANKQYTLFASFLDLGSIVNVRLNNDTAAYPGLRFEHFLSPGLGMFWNWPNSPVTLGVHYSYTPNLRNIAYNSGDAVIREENVSVSRLNASLLVDIPLFTLFNKAK